MANRTMKYYVRVKSIEDNTQPGAFLALNKFECKIEYEDTDTELKEETYTIETEHDIDNILDNMSGVIEWQSAYTCTCGKELEPPGGRGMTRCACGALWNFDYWALNRFPGDTGVTSLEPRQVF